MKSRGCLGMVIGIGFGILTSCQSGESSDDAAPLASVGEKTLSVEQLQQRIPPGMDPEDSIAIVNQYIDQWIREQIFIQQAEQSLSDETVDFEDEVEAYRNALVLHEYKNRFVNKQLNTNVSEEEALNYYQENQQSFVLTDSKDFSSIVLPLKSIRGLGVSYPPSINLCALPAIGKTKLYLAIF